MDRNWKMGVWNVIRSPEEWEDYKAYLENTMTGPTKHTHPELTVYPLMVMSVDYVDVSGPNNTYGWQHAVVLPQEANDLLIATKKIYDIYRCGKSQLTSYMVSPDSAERWHAKRRTIQDMELS